MAPISVVAEPQQITVLIGHLLGYQFGRSGSSRFIGGFVSDGSHSTVMRPKSSRSLSFGIDAVDEFAVFIETVHFRPSQCVGNDAWSLR